MSLKKRIGAFELWGLAVGLVISGEYFGWSYGWEKAGTVGFLGTTLVVAFMYVALVFSFTELATMFPKAGGPYVFTEKAFGPKIALLAGTASAMEFLFAPGAIAFALGGYLKVIFPALDINQTAIGLLLLFGCVNVFGVQISTRFELVVTVIAVLELLVFTGVAAPSFQWDNYLTDAFPNGISGCLAALPFAVWFFLAIEGVAFASEEVKDPHRTIPIGYLTGILTLVVLAVLVMLSAGGVGDWKQLSRLDDPIPHAIKMALGDNHSAVKWFASIGLFGLVASLNGIIYGASRQVYALSSVGVLPRSLATLNRHHVPAHSVFFTVLVGVISVLSGNTQALITMSVFGAVTMYALCMLSLLKLRRSMPDMERPYRTPFYPWFPLSALGLSLLTLATMVYFQETLFALFCGGLLIGSFRNLARKGNCAAGSPSKI